MCGTRKESVYVSAGSAGEARAGKNAAKEVRTVNAGMAPRRAE